MCLNMDRFDWNSYLRGEGDFLNLRLQKFVSIGFCTYSWLIRLIFWAISYDIYYAIFKQKISIAADPTPPQSWKMTFFRLFANILQYFHFKIVFKIVQDKF